MSDKNNSKHLKTINNKVLRYITPLQGLFICRYLFPTNIIAVLRLKSCRAAKYL